MDNLSRSLVNDSAVIHEIHPEFVIPMISGGLRVTECETERAGQLIRAKFLSGFFARTVSY